MSRPETDRPARNQSVGVMLPRDLPAGRVLGFVVEAEERGFDEVWVVEDLGYRGGIAQAAAALALTSRIRVGVGILPAAARNPAFAAMEIATLAELFPGRVDLGVGHGLPAWMRQVGTWPASPLTLLAEWLDAVRALLAGERVTRDGRYVRLDDVALEMVPSVPPPLLAGVRGPKSLAVAGRWADGTVLAEPAGPEYVRAALEQIAGGQQIGDRPHRVVAYEVARVEDDPDRAVAAARPALLPFAEPDWSPHLVPMSFAAEWSELQQSCASAAELVERVPADWVRQLTLAGTPDQVRERIAGIHDAGASSVVLMPEGPDALESLARAL